MPTPPVDEQVRFWSKVDRSGGPSACWLWMGYRQYGYGVFSRRGKGAQTWRAHRMAYAFIRGPIPAGLFVCHTCDVRHCVNPAHLFLGTHEDNMRDMHAKGRAAVGERHYLHGNREVMGRLQRLIKNRPRGDRHVSRTHPELLVRGETVHGAKLTESQVRDIRAEYAATRSPTTLARKYGVTTTTINSLVRRKTWKHVA